VVVVILEGDVDRQFQLCDSRSNRCMCNGFLRTQAMGFRFEEGESDLGEFRVAGLGDYWRRCPGDSRLIIEARNWMENTRNDCNK